MRHRAIVGVADIGLQIGGGDGAEGGGFKNPDGAKAWELIDAAGCRGMRKSAAVSAQRPLPIPNRSFLSRQGSTHGSARHPNC